MPKKTCNLMTTPEAHAKYKDLGKELKESTQLSDDFCKNPEAALAKQAKKDKKLAGWQDDYVDLGRGKWQLVAWRIKEICQDGGAKGLKNEATDFDGSGPA